VAATDTHLPSAEYQALREACGLIDRSERGKLALSGPGAVEFLDGQVTNELADLHPGEGRYAAFLTHKGKMLGDLRILAVAREESNAGIELLLDTERVALQALFDMIRRFKVGYEVELHKRTVERGLLSLIGPAAERIAGGELVSRFPCCEDGQCAGLIGERTDHQERALFLELMPACPMGAEVDRSLLSNLIA